MPSSAANINHEPEIGRYAASLQGCRLGDHPAHVTVTVRYSEPACISGAGALQRMLAAWNLSTAQHVLYDPMNWRLGLGLFSSRKTRLEYP
jgi:hypothetical protein